MATGENDACPEKYVMVFQSEVSAVFPVVNVICIIPSLDFFRKLCYNHMHKLFSNLSKMEVVTLVEIKEIQKSTIKLTGISFKDSEAIQKITEVCHHYKHMYRDGYPVGRKTRKKTGKRFYRWTDCPEISFTYLIMPDTSGQSSVKISIYVSDIEETEKKYSKEEISYFMNMFVQNIADGILQLEL